MKSSRARSLKTLSLSVGFCILSFAGAQTSAMADEVVNGRGQPVDVEVMSYNIHHAEGIDGSLDVERIAKVIADSGADIIGLQEVDNHWSTRSDFQDQARLLAMRLGMFYEYAANLDLDPANSGEPRRQYGTAVLSKYPILDADNHSLAKIGTTEQRGLLEATINVKGNQLHFYNTHLALTTAERTLQIQEILNISGKSEGPKVIMGDLNALPESVEMVPLNEMYYDVFAGQPGDYTYPATNPTKRIDYIFTSDDIEIEKTEVIRSLASDHLPLTAELELDRDDPFHNGEE
ncbi:endonuclease/exonuclease/phosphatase family protein [Mesobacillus zeae]|uniref:Endonuclease/exonuclease/phosphatase n=1 Tax=Mesobacillus zeae TaxID=1917180 RepID=A0A398AXE4_9BACI|nr:endonuclease/exonuclease/phosphatase family protein [Mesobacillus zeae]RID82322.1 endonuclease/exonuclease/phosphatase [Mesobacillus zeae]